MTRPSLGREKCETAWLRRNPPMFQSEEASIPEHVRRSTKRIHIYSEYVGILGAATRPSHTPLPGFIVHSDTWATAPLMRQWWDPSNVLCGTVEKSLTLRQIYIPCLPCTRTGILQGTTSSMTLQTENSCNHPSFLWACESMDRHLDIALVVLRPPHFGMFVRFMLLSSLLLYQLGGRVPNVFMNSKCLVQGRAWTQVLLIAVVDSHPWSWRFPLIEMMVPVLL
jgi:hypothetical protein